MSEPEFIVFRTYLNHFEADVAKTALEADGIECFIRSDDCGGMRPHFWLAGVELLLRPDDAEHAEEILGADDDRQPSESATWETTDLWQVSNPD